MRAAYDRDWIVVGSGFGGSVAALRLAEKGYDVSVLECGRRFADEDFATTTWNLRRYYWAPRLGLKGILRLTLFKDVLVASGCGVGGGSLGYANTLYRARPAFYSDPQWAELDEWERVLGPHYEEAERMLGVTTYEREGPADQLIRELGAELGVADSYTRPPVGVFLGEPGRIVPDPYFGGEGPDRAGCVRCGSCMVGCRHNAKNTLVKNYLWFAERLGVRILPARTVVDIRPLGAADGSDGYQVVSERSGTWLRRDRCVHTARGVVVAAGALGTNLLLQACRSSGSLPRLSKRLGEKVRTNSEAILAVTTRDDRRDFTGSIAITSSVHPDAHTHVENVTYGRGADSMSLLFTLLTGPGTRLTRPLRFLAEALRHPGRLLRVSWPVGWSRRTVILLVMQTLDNSIALRARRRWLGRGVRLQTEQDPQRPNPTFIPVANWAAARAAEKLDGIAQSGATEALLNIPTTAHILGGAVIAAEARSGVVDRHLRAFGYRNLLVCDGSVIPANVGANPSLTIAALAELAMAQVERRSASSTASDRWTTGTSSRTTEGSSSRTSTPLDGF